MDHALVLGGTGFVGRELVDTLHVQGASLSGKDGTIPCDVTDPVRLRTVLDQVQPSTVVNCVGLADVDRAEKDAAQAVLLNETVVSLLAAEHARRAFRLVHISTDYVFDGRQGNYREEDHPHPINTYGQTKLRGEEIARRIPDALILRISSPYGMGFGARKVQFFRYVVDSLRAGKRVRALTDQRITPTYLPDLAGAVDRLTSLRATGVFHVGGIQPWSRYDFAREVARIAGQDPNLVDPTTSTEMTTWVAQRPLDTSLNVQKSVQLGVHFTPVPEALTELLRKTSQ